MTIALVDGDLITYRSASSCHPTKVKAFMEPCEVALMRIDTTMSRILDESGATSYEVYIGGQDNYRYELYPEYKANRLTTPKPPYLEDCREYLISKWNAKIVNSMETDDMLGIRQTESTIICSLDKDLLMIPGRHYNWVKQVFTTVSEEEGMQRFYKQIITGDGADHIPAFDGMFRSQTPQFVQRILDPIDAMHDELDMYDYVLGVFDGDTETMHRNAKLVYILREEGKFWQPPNHGQERVGIASL